MCGTRLSLDYTINAFNSAETIVLRKGPPLLALRGGMISMCGTRHVFGLKNQCSLSSADKNVLRIGPPLRAPRALAKDDAARFKKRMVNRAAARPCSPSTVRFRMRIKVIAET